MNSLGSSRLNGFQNGRNIQIAILGRCRTNTNSFIRHQYMSCSFIRIRINGNRFYTHLFQGSNNATSDFATICYKYFVEHGYLL